MSIPGSGAQIPPTGRHLVREYLPGRPLRCTGQLSTRVLFLPEHNEWSEGFAQGDEILAYWQGLAEKYNLQRFLNLGHQINSAEWDDGDLCGGLSSRISKLGNCLKRGRILS